MHIAARQGDLRMLAALQPYCNPDVRQAGTGCTALHLAAAAGQTAAAVWLVTQAGASMSTKNNQGLTAGELAIREGQAQVGQTLHGT